MKTLDDNWTDWEGHVFGYGYGTGEPHIIVALKQFMAAIPANDRRYDYPNLEAELSPTVTWLMINTLCHANIIEYGTSPRFGWLTEQGVALRSYLSGKTTNELYELATRNYDNDGYVHCYVDVCNCAGGLCKNPFWVDDHDRKSSQF